VHAARAAIRRAKSLRKRNPPCRGSLENLKDLFWRWKAVRLETRLGRGSLEVMAMLTTMAMGSSVGSLYHS
jgi:hypothetical protein